MASFYPGRAPADAVGQALLTDLYELRMAASFRRRKMEGAATFSLFVRALPPGRGYLVACGVEECLDFLSTLAVGQDDLDVLASMGFDDDSLEALRGLRFSGEAWGVPEGRVVFAEEPLLEVTAPIAEAQLAETYLLNQITFATAVASKAARCVTAARGAGVVDFSFRRTQGVEAALIVARASTLAGFAGTSNVEAARRLGIPAVGTMAHSYVEAFPSELDAFRAFARDFPNDPVFLVDTYDTLSGVRTAIEVINEHGLGDRAGIRLDSGDLLSLSRQARALLDAAGLTGTRILASGGLDELSIEELRAADAPIDAFGVGTNLGVSADAPALESVYKLVEYDGRAVMKLSSGKTSAPGRKQVFRSDGGDVIALRDDAPAPGDDPLLVPMLRGGTRLAPRGSLADARARLESDVSALPADVRRVRDPAAYPVEWSTNAQALTRTIASELGGRSHRFRV